jgi:hypothetical protein
MQRRQPRKSSVLLGVRPNEHDSHNTAIGPPVTGCQLLNFRRQILNNKPYPGGWFFTDFTYAALPGIRMVFH